MLIPFAYHSIVAIVGLDKPTANRVKMIQKAFPWALEVKIPLQSHQMVILFFAECGVVFAIGIISADFVVVSREKPIHDDAGFIVAAIL